MIGASQVLASARLRRLTVLAAALCSGCDYWRRLTPLAAAARAGDSAEIERLASGGVDLNEPSGERALPPVLHAIECRQLEALRQLFEHGAFIHGQTGRRAVDLARRLGCDDILRFLAERGVRLGPS